MGSTQYTPRMGGTPDAFHGDGEREAEGLGAELVPEHFELLSPDELFLSEHGRHDNYRMRMMLRGL